MVQGHVSRDSCDWQRHGVTHGDSLQLQPIVGAAVRVRSHGDDGGLLAAKTATATAADKMGQCIQNMDLGNGKERDAADD